MRRRTLNGPELYRTLSALTPRSQASHQSIRTTETVTSAVISWCWHFACIAGQPWMIRSAAAKTAGATFLVLARLVDLIDHHHINRRFDHSHFEPELLLHRGEQVWRRVSVRYG